MNYLDVVMTCVGHMLMTFPSFIYHGLSNYYNRVTAEPFNEDICKLKNKKVIVFVHGRGGHFTNFNSLINRLKLFLIEHHMIALDMGDTHYSSIDEETNKLHNFLSQMENCKITLVGLSKGGLVVMRYITQHSDPRIQNVITIASPLYGTLIASCFPNSSIVYKELSLMNPLVSNIIRSNVSCDNIYHIVPNYDHLIIPKQAAYYTFTPNENLYFYLGYHNHIGIQHDKKVADVIAHWLY
jgi:triacylglycerol esterase/lipase EstA (alpha/beta hydrolase family)